MRKKANTLIFKIQVWILLFVFLFSNVAYVGATGKYTETEDRIDSEPVLEDTFAPSEKELVNSEEVDISDVSEESSLFEEDSSGFLDEKDSAEERMEDLSESNEMDLPEGRESSENEEQEDSENMSEESDVENADTDNSEDVFEDVSLEVQENNLNEPMENYYAAGEELGIRWTISQDGILEIAGKQNKSGNLSKGWLEYNYFIKSAKVSAQNMTSMNGWFENCSNLTSIDFSGADTSRVTDMSHLFSNCMDLKSFEWGNFNTSKVTTMEGMFEYCFSLDKLDLRIFDTKNVKTFKKMFYYAQRLSEIDLSSFNTKNVNDMSWMFGDCTSLKKLDLSNFDTKNVKSFSGTFYRNMALEELDVSNFDTSNATDMGQMFTVCSNLESLDVSNFNTAKVTSMVKMFESCTKLKRLDVSNFRTDNVKDFMFMFAACYKVEELDVGSFNTSKCTSFRYMFFGCESLTQLDLSSFNTSKATDFEYMFADCGELTELDLSSFNTAKAISMYKMFENCINLSEVNLSSFKTNNLTNAIGMFENCILVDELDISSFRTSKLKYANSMFEGCASLKTLDLSRFDFGQIEECNDFLTGCTSLRYVQTIPKLRTDIVLPYTMYTDTNEEGAYKKFPKDLSVSVGLHTYVTITVNDDGKETKLTGILAGIPMELPKYAGKDEYSFEGWYTQPNGKGMRITDKTPISENMTIYAYYVHGLWIDMIYGEDYTGNAIKPIISVYDGDNLLTLDKDYTLSYRNNVNAGYYDDKNAPTVIVKGKGQYKGTETETFTIYRKDLSASDVLCLNEYIYKKANGKVQKPVPEFTYNGKKLKYKKDFELSYPDTAPEAYTEPGVYPIEVNGIGNYTDKRIIYLEITDAVLMDSVKIDKIPDQEYTGKAVKPEVKVTYKGNQLEYGKDYILSYENNVEVGVATVIVEGIDSYEGKKVITFKIKGISLSKAKVTGIENKVYSGLAQRQSPVVRLGDETIDTGAYTISYANNVNAGTATIIIQGIKNYTGTIKKTFKITPYDISADENEAIRHDFSDTTVTFEKGGATPLVNISHKNVQMILQKDYSLSYANNKKVALLTDRKAPTVLIKGKGNFKGTIKVPFSIKAKDLTDVSNPIDARINDVVYSGKAGKYISKPILTDSDGKKLVAGTDYDKNIIYSKDGVVLNNKKDIPSVGSIINATISGKGNYTGTIQLTYRITKKSISSAKIKISAKAYTGKEITLNEDEIAISVAGKKLKQGKDYVIIGYSNNINKGNAKVIIRGIGNYGGEKSVSMTITEKKFVWFWNIF